jgi:2-methylcitrate dehydratase PrpD
MANERRSPEASDDPKGESVLLSRRDALRSGVLLATLPFMDVAPAFAAGRQAPSRPAQREYPRPTGTPDPLMPRGGPQTAADYPVSENTRRLSAHISQARSRPLPAEVVEKSKWHILDSFAAIVSGTQLPAGRVATAFARAYAGGNNGVSTVIGETALLGPMEAAMLNGTMGHADETDDTLMGPWHPGINVIPAALALGEHLRITGEHFLRAVTLGYDVGTRILLAAGTTVDFLGPTNSLGGVFGAAATAACVAGLNQQEARWAMSYAAQQCSGLDSFRRDPEHVEKGFMNGGLGARAGVTAAMLVKAGFTGLNDIFAGQGGFFEPFVARGQAHPEWIVDALGEDYYILRSNFKRYPVGGPVQAALDGLRAIFAQRPVDPNQIREIRIRGIQQFITDNAGPLAINLQHGVALMLIDKHVDFRNINDSSRRNDPAIVRLRSLSSIINEPLPGSGVEVPALEIILNDGTRLVGDAPRSSGPGVTNTYTREWVIEKAVMLMTPVLGKAMTDQLVDRCLNLENLENILELRRFLQLKYVPGAAPRLSEWPTGMVNR